ncbi:hypothetical protein [Salinispora arenicola]|uniref:hypothetical protein n=1 Tax=Salinispora arenicola TaxID=168697 RepID=UPI000575E449|nr:hypothetical protein [Salinispora arenicola]NIL59438.1 hypothetical protein [Salinispora arenicola]NIL63520.1 hypothetical protein [Salinispora arenicola]
MVRQRMVADRCTVSEERVCSKPALVGYRAQTRALTRMHVFAVCAAVDRVEEAGLSDFVSAAVNLGLNRKGHWRGMQSGVIVLPVLVTTATEARAIALTQKVHRLHAAGYAALAQPAVVDMVAGTVWTFRGTRLWGYVHSSLIKQKFGKYLPEPFEAS